MNPARLYSGLLSRLTSNGFSLRELARDTAELGAITLFGWGLLELVRAI